jgi:hypothetical protein
MLLDVGLLYTGNKMYKTIVTIISEEYIHPDIDILSLAHACDNGDEIGVVSIDCFKLDKPEKAPYLAEEEEDDEPSMHGWHK